MASEIVERLRHLIEQAEKRGDDCVFVNYNLAAARQEANHIERLERVVEAAREWDAAMAASDELDLEDLPDPKVALAVLKRASDANTALHTALAALGGENG